jgi:Tfp pilus assembly protein PilO
MSNQWSVRLMRLDRRVRALGIAVFLFLLISQGWMLVLKTPVAEYRRMLHDQVSLETGLLKGQGLAAETEQLVQQVAALDKRAQGAALGLSVDQAVVQLMRKLDHSAGLSGVVLTGVKPGTGKRVLMFDEIPLDVEARGTYAALVEWLQAVERGDGTFAITQFEMKPGAPSSQLVISLKLAAYHAN